MNSLLKTNQQALCFARRSENLSSDLRIKNGLRLYNDKEVVHWINPKAKNNVYHPSNYYAFNRLNFKAINRLLLEASEREDQMKKQGYNLEGVKSFNRNVWLDISRESNAIEGIFRDFSFDLLDFRAKLKGKIASDPSTKNFDRQDYFNKLFDQILEVQQHNDSIVITGKEHPHKLSMQTVRHFIAFKYAYKCAKKDRFQKVTKEEFLNMLLNVNSLIFGGSGGGDKTDWPSQQQSPCFWCKLGSSSRNRRD